LHYSCGHSLEPNYNPIEGIGWPPLNLSGIIVFNMSWIRIHRKIKDNWIWSDPIRLKWWLDILLTVNHEDSKCLIKGTLIECKRGQSVRSLDTWATTWGVSKKTVFAFFLLLKKDTMLETENLKVTTRITVLNYDSYNQQKTKIHHDWETQKGTPKKRQLPTNNNDKEYNNTTNVVLFGTNENFLKFQAWQKENTPTLLQMKEPFTEKQFEKMKTKWHWTYIAEMCQRMHNYQPLLKKYKSAYLTFTNWVKLNEK